MNFTSIDNTDITHAPVEEIVDAGAEDSTPQKELLQVIPKIFAHHPAGNARKAVILQPQLAAQVAELVDAADSKSAVRKDVLVRFQSWALNRLVSH